jgi:hypothetical protein
MRRNMFIMELWPATTPTEVLRAIHRNPRIIPKQYLKLDQAKFLLQTFPVVIQ